MCSKQGRAVWGGLDGAFVLNEASLEWERVADGVRLGATLAMCGGELMSVGGMEDGSISKEVGGRWTSMSNMLVECMYPCVVSRVGLCGEDYMEHSF